MRYNLIWILYSVNIINNKIIIMMNSWLKIILWIKIGQSRIQNYSQTNIDISQCLTLFHQQHRLLYRTI